MPSSYSIGAIGSDPMFQTAYNSYNANYLAQQNDATRVARIPSSEAYQQAVTTNPMDAATQYMTSQTETVSPRYVTKEESHTGRNLAIAVGAAAIIYACYKGKNGNPIDGAKTIWNELKGVFSKVTGKGSSKSIKAILGKDVQEYTVMKDGMEFLMKDGKPAKIITADKKVITDAAKVAEWVENNTAAKDLIRNLNVSSGSLPKGVSLSYTKEIADGANLYRLTVENGKVVKAASKDKAGKFIEVAEKDLASFIKNHGAQIKEAETLTKTTALDHVRLLNSSGKLYDAGSKNITWSVRNGKVVSANIGGRTLKPEEIQALQKDFGKEIKLFGKEAASTYNGINGFEYIYRTSKVDAGIAAGQRIRFSPNVSGHSGKNWITSINGIESKELTGAEEIKKFLEGNTEIKNGLDQITSSARFTNGFRLGNYQVKAGSGNIFTVNGNGRVLEIKLADGSVIKGNDAIKNWRKVAENNNEFNVICPALS